MITNERQLRITKKEIERFRNALDSFKEEALARQGVDPIIARAQRKSLMEQLAELKAEVARYERLRSGKLRRLATGGLADIGERLIEGRILLGLTQRALGKRLGMKEQQVQRYEQERYRTASLARLAEIAEALQLDLHAFFEVTGRGRADRN